MNRPRSLFGILVTIIVLVVVLFLGVALFGYLAHGVGDNEIGVQLRSNRIREIVGPGVYTDISPFADIVDVNVGGLPFCAEDEEVLTSDQQRIGVRVCGTVFRPGLEGSETYRRLWASYKTFYTNDVALVGETSKDGVVISLGLMTDLGQQAMKVCVGDRKFSEAAVGSARDDLRECIGEQMSLLVQPYGLKVGNIVVPNISIHPTVQALLDSITESKFQTDLARQNALKADAEADRQLAEQQGQIRVEQGKVQEQERQRAITADLERQALESELVVIVAEKANELQDAQLALEVTQAELAVATAQAQADLADVFLLAGLYEDNPAYLEYLIAQQWASAWSATDKIIVPQGTNPNTILNPDGADIVIPVPATGE